MVMLAQGVRAGIDIWNAQTRRSARPLDFDAGIRVLREILTTIPVEPAALGASVAIKFKGQPGQVKLVGRLPTGLGGTRLVDMTIARETDRVVIAWSPYRHDDQQPSPPPTLTDVIRNVMHLEFAYLGSAKPNLPAAWLSRWDGPDLPQLIRVRIDITADDYRRQSDLLIAPQL